VTGQRWFRSFDDVAGQTILDRLNAEIMRVKALDHSISHIQARDDSLTRSLAVLRPHDARPSPGDTGRRSTTSRG
jgi:hypothetical protein